MFYGVSHVVVSVSDLTRAAGLWQNVMGFTRAGQGEDFVDIDTGSVVIRLLAVPRVTGTVSLRLAVGDVGAAYRQLLAAGAGERYAPMKTPEREEMACVSDADGHVITLWRALTEDELDFVPELPKQGSWLPEAEQLLQRLLAHVPALFRMLARRKTTRVIETLAREAGSPVTRDLVIRGYITSSAKVTRYRLEAPLRAEGIDPEDYRAEFDYE